MASQPVGVGHVPMITIKSTGEIFMTRSLLMVDHSFACGVLIGQLDQNTQHPDEAEEEPESHILDNSPAEGPDWVELGEGNNTLMAAMVGVKPGATVMVRSRWWF